MAFLEALIDGLNKDEKQVQTEALIDKVEDYRIELEGRILNLESIEMVKLKTELIKLEGREMRKAVKAKTDATFNLGDNFNEWIDNINDAEKAHTKLLNNIEDKKSLIAKAESKLTAYKDLLTKIS